MRGLPVVRPVSLDDSSTLRALRDRTREAAGLCGLPADRAADLVTAVSEAGMNAVVHAHGGRARICRTPDSNLQVWVTDHGPGIAMEALPRATLERGFSTAGSLGHGFWLMLNTADYLYVSTNNTGTTIVLEQGSSPPNAWQ